MRDVSSPRPCRGSRARAGARAAARSRTRSSPPPIGSRWRRGSGWISSSASIWLGDLGVTGMRDGVFSLAVVLLSACGSPSEQNLKSLRDKIESGPPPSLTAGHAGPGVAAAGTGAGRFVRFLLPAFRRDRAMHTPTFADRYYREPGNEGFEGGIDHVHAELEKAGDGERDPLRLEVIQTTMSSKAWTPRRGGVVLKISGSPDRTLPEFPRPEDRDRPILPKNAPLGAVA